MFYMVNYEDSFLSNQLRGRGNQLQAGAVLDSRGSEANFFTQALTLTMRSLTNMNRDFGYYWLRLGMYIVLCIAIGTIYFDAGSSYTAIAVSTRIWNLSISYLHC